MKKYLLVLAMGLSALGAEWYVAPGANGNGTLASPGSLLTAVDHSSWASSITGGDTVWLRGGSYTNPVFQVTNFYSFSVNFGGSAGNYVTWRSYSNEWAVVDGTWDFDTHGYHQFMHMEFWDSHKSTHVYDVGNPSYITQDGPISHFKKAGLAVNGRFMLINCVLHDIRAMAMGGKHIQDCIIWSESQNGYEHIVYSDGPNLQNNIFGWLHGALINFPGGDGFMYSSNIVFGKFEKGFDITDSDGVVIGNRVYNPYVDGAYIATLTAHDSAIIITNNTFVGDGITTTFRTQDSVDFRWNTVVMFNNAQSWPVFQNTVGGVENWTMDYNNYYAKSPRPVLFRDITGGTEENLTFNQWRAKYPSRDANSVYGDSSMPPNAVHVYPNLHQPKRAHIAIYNWTHADNVSVNLSGVLANGDPYKLWSAQNFLAGPISTGVYSGPISIPMTNLAVAPKLSGTNAAPTAVSPEFGAFLVIGPATPDNPYPGGGLVYDYTPPEEEPEQPPASTNILNKTISGGIFGGRIL